MAADILVCFLPIFGSMKYLNVIKTMLFIDHVPHSLHRNLVMLPGDIHEDGLEWLHNISLDRGLLGTK